MNVINYYGNTRQELFKTKEGVKKMNEKLAARLESLVTSLQEKGDELIDPGLRKNNETQRDVLQELSNIMQKIAAIVITQKSEEITIKSSKKKIGGKRKKTKMNYLVKREVS